MSKGQLVLNQVQLKQKIRRIAFQIFENHFKEKEIILAGIVGKGYSLAKLLANELDDISTLKTKLVEISLDKEAPSQSEIRLDCDPKTFVNKSIVVVDDVLNTGRTLAYSLKPFLNSRVHLLETAVLVNRSHIQFPIMANYTGYELSTTIHEHIEVTMERGKMGVYLS